jgi:hypothetical protein
MATCELLYLLFMTATWLVAVMAFNHNVLRSRLYISSSRVLVFQVLTVIDVTAIALITCLFFDPKYELRMHSCHAFNINDWYSSLSNPRPPYGKTLLCGNEANYPMQSWLLLFDALYLVHTIFFRTLAIHFICNKDPGISVERIKFYTL